MHRAKIKTQAIHRTTGITPRSTHDALRSKKQSTKLKQPIHKSRAKQPALRSTPYARRSKKQSTKLKHPFRKSRAKQPAQRSTPYARCSKKQSTKLEHPFRKSRAKQHALRSTHDARRSKKQSTKLEHPFRKSRAKQPAHALRPMPDAAKSKALNSSKSFNHEQNVSPHQLPPPSARTDRGIYPAGWPIPGG